MTPYARVRQQLIESAAAGGLIHVVGARGTGKRYQACAWLRERTGQDPEVFAAADVVFDGADWARGEAVLVEGRGIVVVGGPDPPGDLHDRLQRVAEIPRVGLQPGARIVFTERTENGSIEVGSPEGPGTVRVPSLSDLRDEVSEIVREVAATCVPDAPPRFSPAALQRLLAWEWPGNVAELVDVLTALPKRAGEGLVQVADLPDRIGAAPTSRNRYEEAERDAIERVLAETEGNKSLAAEILGIGRTTLYRKMRSLKIRG